MSGTDGPRSGFLGTLRSELDDDEGGLDEAFETLATACGVARAAFMEFRLTAEKAAELFAMLRLNSVDGQEWTVGATTGTWYRRPVGSPAWERAIIPVGVTPDLRQPPHWLTAGVVDEYLRVHEVDPSSPEHAGAAGPAEPEPSPIFPASFTEPGAVHESGVPLPASIIGAEEDDWLSQEWASFETGLDQLRQIRTGTAPVPVTAPELPEHIPADWNADVALSEALNAPADGPAPRAPEPVVQTWTPQPPAQGGGFLPNEFFLPPDE